jgi:cytochrome c biogenesis protein CcdA/thiol-disulfide isomerase/thioredoxin
MNPPLIAIAFVGGALTIASPCVLPVLPFVFSRAARPFASHGLPLLLGLAVAFAAVASLAAVGGGWAVAANQYGRYAAIVWIALCGGALLSPALAGRLARPFVALGNRLGQTEPGTGARQRTVLSSAVLGIATGLLWTPCAGPILGLILAGATLHGPSADTSLLLLAYATGACASLAVALVAGGRLRALPVNWGAIDASIRRVAGVTILLGVAGIATGVDARVLSRISLDAPSRLEQSLVERLTVDTARSTPKRAGDPPEITLESEGDFPSLAGATEWIGSAPLTPQALRGKVVLIDFWTYSCINCLRTLPYVRAWADKYRAAGLVVIGVHSPEFAFEKRTANVRSAVEDLHIGFPIAVDGDRAVWRAFDNSYWPAFYFIDAQGRIRHHHFGEGGYARSEQVIQQLLAEAGRTGLPGGSVSPQGDGVEAAAAATPPLSDETYLGYEQASGFASPGGLLRGRAKTYSDVIELARGQWALNGQWTAERDRVVSSAPASRIVSRFNARDVHLVLGPAPDGRPVRFRVRIDGQPPLADHGFDTDAQGLGSVTRHRLYQLVRQRANRGDRTVEIEFLDPGVQAHVFTFG